MAAAAGDLFPGFTETLVAEGPGDIFEVISFKTQVDGIEGRVQHAEFGGQPADINLLYPSPLQVVSEPGRFFRPLSKNPE